MNVNAIAVKPITNEILAWTCKDLVGLSQEQFDTTLKSALEKATTFKEQGNIIISGAVVLFWDKNKSVHPLNKALAYAKAYRGISTIKVVQFLKYFTGATFDKDAGEFVKGGKMSAKQRDKRSKEFLALTHWGDWAHAKEKEEQERLYNAANHRDRLVKKLEKELTEAKAQVESLNEKLTAIKMNFEISPEDQALKVAELTAAMVSAETYRQQCEAAVHAFH